MTSDEPYDQDAHDEAVQGLVQEGVLIPLPTLEDIETDLSPEQEARVSALHQARGILERRGGVMQGPTASTPPPVTDLLLVASYILHGRLQTSD